MTTESSKEEAGAESIAEDREALTAPTVVSRTPTVEVRTREEEEKEIEERVHGWKVVLVGMGTHNRHYPKNAAEADAVGHFVAWRKGETTGFALSAVEHWLRGDAYFKELMVEHHLNIVDMLGIVVALREYAASHGTPLPPQKERTGEAAKEDCYECGDSAPFGIPWGNDHRGGPTPVGGHTPGKPQPGLPGNPSKVHPPGWGSGINPSGQQHPQGPPAPPVPEQAWLNKANGILRGDPSPQPVPAEVAYLPQAGEVPENFKCGGVVYYGYKASCLDYQGMPTEVRLMATDIPFILRYSGIVQQSMRDASLRRLLQHMFFNDGKGTDCQASCEIAGLAVAGVGFGGLVTLCGVATAVPGGPLLAGGPCVSGLSGLIAGTTATFAGGAIGIKASYGCKAAMCTD